MAFEIQHAGELNRPLEFFEKQVTKNAASERKETLNTMGVKFGKRVEGTGNEDEEGKTIPFKTATFFVRFDAELMQKGESLVIKDIDGEFHVKHVGIAGPGINRFLSLKARKRG